MAAKACDASASRRMRCGRARLAAATSAARVPRRCTPPA